MTLSEEERQYKEKVFYSIKPGTVLYDQRRSRPYLCISVKPAVKGWFASFTIFYMSSVSKRSTCVTIDFHMFSKENIEIKLL